ncbi:MAG: hypothetical protein MHPSP_004444, partial [Paramarteilia canceri]
LGRPKCYSSVISTLVLFKKRPLITKLTMSKVPSKSDGQSKYASGASEESLQLISTVKVGYKLIKDLLTRINAIMNMLNEEKDQLQKLKDSFSKYQGQF